MKIGKRSYKILASPQVNRTEKKHLGPALPKNGVSTMCARGKHSECYAISCRCKKCPCKVNI